MTSGAGRGAVFFDRDGVLNVDTGYLYDPADFVWVEGAPEAIAAAKAAGLLVVVATNQSGVARGYYEESHVHALHAFMNDDLTARGLPRIDAFYHCPYNDVGSVDIYVRPDHPDRKPNPGMLLRAIADHGLDPMRCVMIGDKESDVEAGFRAGMRALRFEGGKLDALTRRALAELLDSSAAAS
ncbi:HAD-IIIA family hydrolase [Methylosinus sp. Sm6]|uniref:D-glycero-alpha-D-manno-heptose-1,7-bisphosphate 7-phosphatase n=1 Tax=Methylosinus sp. Sm6 TaxID=2866948 RepID=UPI001C99BED1|nr:HAD family hydrolase [Methylosinus sp. Sm6]MBY6241623.1 HAD family hydrolase [Methylosinus sp. Sm6]